MELDVCGCVQCGVEGAGLSCDQAEGAGLGSLSRVEREQGLLGLQGRNGECRDREVSG